MSKKTLLIAIIVFLFLMIGTGVAFFVLWGKISESKSDVTSAQVNGNEGALSKGKKDLFPLKTFVVNLADTGGKRYLRVKMVLELNNEGLISEMEENLPHVNDKILMILPSKTFNAIKAFEGKMALKNEIMNGLNSFLKEGRITNVYFEEFVVQ
jgi:flagellar protein FliL